MKIKAPLHSMDARGRMGVGFVLSNWRGTSVARVFVVPRNPRSSRQLTIRALMTSASREWTSLTDAFRLGWTVYSTEQSRKNIFGQSITASGFNEYCALFVLASDIGGTPVSEAPITVGPLMVTDGVIEGGALAGEIDVDWTAGQGGFVDVWMSKLLPAGRAPKESDYVHNSYTADVTATKTISGLTTGGKYAVRIRQIFDNGQSGPPTVEILTAT